MRDTNGTWLEETTGATRRQMALKIGQTPSTFNRNVDKPEVIIEVCRAYGINPITGLIETGHLTEEELAQVIGESTLENVTSTTLLVELLRRESTKDA